MPLTAGTSLGHYEILAPIGSGGMGEVYQAHDTKLGRDVAIKILPEAFAHDAERLARFQREAKMLAALNHPNIATIYGLDWNPNGRELFYRSGDKMMAVDIATQPNFGAGKPRMLFEGGYELSPFPIPNYDVSPNGQRFLMLKPSQSVQASPTQIVVVQNWFEELKRRVPTGK
jgi:serine/threonine protein kinase